MLGLSLTYAGYNEWHNTIASTNYCQVTPQDWLAHDYPYLLVWIDNERLVEPIFDGRYFINLRQEFGRDPYTLHTTVSGTSTYAPTTYHTVLVWNNNMQNLMMQNTTEQMSFPVDTGHHMFPFDSARFHEQFAFTPPVHIDAVLIKNAVAGFYMPCPKVSFHTANGSTEVSFRLKRNPLIVYTAVLLLITAAMLAVFITMFVERGPLPQALASYYFAVWSIRALFGLTAEGFPTLFDIGIVLLASLIPLLLFLRILGLPEALRPIGRHGINLVRKLEGRELL
jgi:hypothetical protein